MRVFTALILMTLLLCGGNALAKVESAKLTLDDSSPGEAPAFSLLADEGGKLLIEFRLPALDSREFTFGGQLYSALGIPGGNLRGEEGEAGLPTITRLVAVPAGAVLSARVVSADEHRLDGIRILPVQPDDADRFVIDEQYYGLHAELAPPAVEIGEPARLHGQTVVPLTFRPVSYDPASGRMSAASRMEVELEISGGEREDSRVVPESFHRLFMDTVLGYRAEEMTVVPGTYLMFCRNDASALAAIEPVLDWRRRQGYNVVLETLTGAESSAQIKAVIQGYYDSVNPPLEHVSIVGDANGTYDIPAGAGEGDHAYAMLDGGDQLADIHIGRLSVQTLAELNRVVDKIVTYEIDPPTSDIGWFTRGCVAGDPSNSGTSTIYVSQWCKAELLAHGYTQVDTIFGGNFVTQMSASLNQGLSAFSYRGYLGMSGMSTGNISNLSNGFELPFAVLPTCGSGSWVGDNTCRSEAFLRAMNGGAIGAIATATLSTHTRYNNCLFNGTWEGAINGSDHTMGSAFSRGKLELFINYINYESSAVANFSQWNNLMGDPATDAWTGVPATMAVTHATTLPTGANAVPVSVTVGGLPLAGARVCAYQEGQLSVSGYTDAGGGVTLPLAGTALGTLSITVIAHDHFPYLGDIALGFVSTFAGYEAHDLDDDGADDSMGNGDGTLNSNETIELPVALRNFGNGIAGGVSASLSSADAYVTVTDAIESFGDIGPGEIVWSAEDFDFQVSGAAPDGHVVILDLLASNGFDEWASQIRIPVVSSAFSLESSSWDGGGGSLDPGESGNLTVEIRNTGSLLAGEVTAVLSSNSPWVFANALPRNYGGMAVDATAAASFALAVSPDCHEGHEAEFSLTLSFDGGRTAVTEFTLPVGILSSNDPTAPDAYGYYAFDDTDLGYALAPVYSWVEIDPNHGGNGTSVGLTDFSYEADDTEVMSLPFDFTYYGQTFDQISICSNGWIAMGVTSLVHWRNWHLPCAGSPNPLIAVFWDDLLQSGNNKVYSHYDGVGGRFIVQWSRMTNQRTGAVENVEVILYDPVRYPTSTGDGKILMQYETVTNNNSQRGYATVGIQNLDGTDGINYTYANDYDPGAATLVAGRAILFQPVDIDTPTAVGDPVVAAGTVLLPNVPNPFNPETRIGFSLAQDQSVALSVFDTRGRKLRTLLAGERMAAGQHAVSWDGRDDRSRPLGSGVYYYVLETGDERLSGKMTLLK